MKVNPITNNTTFSSKIKYNETMQKGFELAKEAAKSPTKKNIDFAKTFSDNIRTILNDGRNDSIEILQKSKINTMKAMSVPKKQTISLLSWT